MTALPPPAISVQDYDGTNYFLFDNMTTSAQRLFRWTLSIFDNPGSANATTDQWWCVVQYWSTASGWVDMWRLPNKGHTVTSPESADSAGDKVANWQALLQSLADIVEPIQLKLD